MLKLINIASSVEQIKVPVGAERIPLQPAV